MTGVQTCALPIYYDAELKALKDRERALKARKVEQLGALVVATGADALDPLARDTTLAEKW